MEKYTTNELLDVLPMAIRKNKELTKKQKLVLAQLYMYDGLEKSKLKGYSYRSNKDFCNDLGVDKKTLLTALKKLEDMNFIERRVGSRLDGASEYVLLKANIDNWCKGGKSDSPHDDNRKIAELEDRIRVLEGLVEKLMDLIHPIETENSTSDTDSITDTETDISNKNINKNKDNNILNNKILNKAYFDNNILDNDREKNLTEKGTDSDSPNWLDKLYLDPTDFEENTDFIEDLNKRLAYSKWDNEDYETA